MGGAVKIGRFSGIDVKDLATRIEDAGLREGFLAAPRVRRMLEHR